MLKLFSKAKIVILGMVMMVGLVSASSPAAANQGNWQSFARSPAMYASNTFYYSTIMSPPSLLPATTKVSYLSWSVAFPYVQNISMITYICSSITFGGCSPAGAGNTSGNPTVPAGTTANQSFWYAFFPYNSSTYPKSTPISVPSAQDTMVVFYNF